MAGVSVEAFLAILAVTAFCVVAAVVTHATTPPSRREPQSSTEVTALGMTVALALLAFMRCSYDAVGSLPGLVIVERCTALAVVTACVMSANTLAVDHVTDLLLVGSVALRWYTVVSMSVAKATAFDNKIVDSIMVGGEDTRMFGLAGTTLALQQTDSQVGDHELVLSSRPVGIH